MIPPTRELISHVHSLGSLGHCTHVELLMAEIKDIPKMAPTVLAIPNPVCHGADI